jgi:hypothetical protein
MMFRKWFAKKVIEPMVISYLSTKGLMMCNMCDNICHEEAGVCDYCERELEMMQQEAYEWGMRYE